MTAMRGRSLIAAVTLMVAAAALAGCGAPAAPETSVLVVADAAALGQPDAWPATLDRSEGLQVETDAVDGADWLAATPRSVRDRVDGAHADVIVLALGVRSGDLGAPAPILEQALRDGVAAAAATGAHVVVLSPAVDQGAGGSSGEWTAAAASVASESGATFVDVSDVAPGNSAEIVSRVEGAVAG